MVENEEIERLLGRSVSSVDAFIAAMEAGNEVDLSGFERAIETITEQIGQLPPESAKAHQGTIETLIERLKVLSGLLVERRDAIKEQLNDTNRQVEAHSAYMKAQGTSPNRSSDDGESSS